MSCEGTINLHFSFDDQNGHGINTEALVSSDLSNEILLSYQDQVNLGILPKGYPNAVQLSKACALKMDTLEAIREDFKDVLSDDLHSLECKCMSGPHMKIHMRDDVTVVPKKALTVRQTPLHLRENADKVVKDLISAGIIVPVSEPTDWISHGHFVRKPDGSARLVTDYTELNKYVKRPVHPFPTSQDIMQSISSGSKFFATLDCKFGYFQIKLDDESSQLTTFLIPQGRHRYTRAPMGLNASGDEFCHRSDIALQGLTGVTKLVDDILIQAPDQQTLLQRIRSVLSRAREHGMTISMKKLQMGTTVKFAGFIVSSDGIKPNPDKIKAIRDFPPPKDVSGVR